MTPTTLKIFDMTYVQKQEDHEISKKLGYTTNEKNRNPGYRNLSLHRKIIKEIAKEALIQRPIFHLGLILHLERIF